LRDHGAAHLSAVERIELADRLISRRRFLIGVGALVLAGCGTQEQASAPTAMVAETRRVNHVMGTTEIPINPQRIIVVGFNEIEDLVALDVRPVGMMFDAFGRAFLTDALRDIPVIGADNAPNLEKIAALNPDLIIAVNWAAEGIYPELSAIAPTVVVSRGQNFKEWRSVFTFIADVVNRSERAAEQLAAYDERTASLRRELEAQQLDRLELSVFGMWNAEYALFNYVDGFAIEVLNDVGLQIAQAQRDAYAADPAVFDSMSLEFLPQLDADYIFLLDSVVDDQQGDKAFAERVKASPLFTQLGAVQAGNVCEVPYIRWNEGSILAANLILDDIERCLLKK